MGKKYTTVAVIAAYNLDIEPMFEFTAYEGIKPSRAAAVVRHNAAMAVAEAEMRAELPSNRKPKVDKQGKRPAVSVTVRGERTMWRTLSVTVAGAFRYILSTDGVEWELLRTRPGYAPKSETFSNVDDIKTVLDQIEYWYWASAQHENLAKRVLGDLLVTE